MSTEDELKLILSDEPTTDYIDIHKDLPKTMPSVANELETAGAQ